MQNDDDDDDYGNDSGGGTGDPITNTAGRNVTSRQVQSDAGVENNTTSTDSRTIEKLQQQVEYWKTTANTLSRIQQREKDTLIRNFTTLRNHLEEKYRRELETLQKQYDTDKRKWESVRQKLEGDISTNRTTKRRRPLPIEDLVDPLRVDKELFSGEVVKALAEGRRINDDDDGVNGPRRPILSASDAVDMAQLLRDERAYKERRQQQQQQQQQRKKGLLSTNNDETDNHDQHTTHGDDIEQVDDRDVRQGKTTKKLLSSTATNGLDPSVDPDDVNIDGVGRSNTDSAIATSKAASSTVQNGDDGDSSDSEEWTLRRRR